MWYMQRGGQIYKVKLRIDIWSSDEEDNAI